jgi:hypothetical protein
MWGGSGVARVDPSVIDRVSVTGWICKVALEMRQRAPLSYGSKKVATDKIVFVTDPLVEEHPLYSQL